MHHTRWGSVPRLLTPAEHETFGRVQSLAQSPAPGPRPGSVEPLPGSNPQSLQNLQLVLP